jgi:hypothetical protein
VDTLFPTLEEVDTLFHSDGRLVSPSKPLRFSNAVVIGELSILNGKGFFSRFCLSSKRVSGTDSDTYGNEELGSSEVKANMRADLVVWTCRSWC